LSVLFATLDKQSGARAESSLATITKTASPIGLKWFFVEMLLYGGVVVPALDALTLKIKSTTPNFKKKGALAPEVE
jgi:hypothetical protein